MAKEGGVRSTPVSKNWLKKHLKELEQKGFIYSTKVVDPIRNLEYTYYTIIPKCSEKREWGVYSWYIDHEAAYQKIIVEFYSALEQMYSFLIANYCIPCEYIRNTGDETFACEEFGCEIFREIYRELRENDSEALIGRGFKTTEIEELQRKVSEWRTSKASYPIPHILEDHTIYLIIDAIYYSRFVSCETCKEAKKCLEAGKKWVSQLLSSYVNALPDSYLKRFWKNILIGVPEIRIDQAYKHFAPRLMLDKDHNPIRFLKIFEKFKMLPYFYSKVIPSSIDVLACDLVELMKHFSSVYRECKKLIE